MNNFKKILTIFVFSLGFVVNTVLPVDVVFVDKAGDRFVVDSFLFEGSSVIRETLDYLISEGRYCVIKHDFFNQTIQNFIKIASNSKEDSSLNNFTFEELNDLNEFLSFFKINSAIVKKAIFLRTVFFIDETGNRLALDYNFLQISPVIRAMLNNGMREEQTREIRHQFSNKTFQILYKFLQPNILPDKFLMDLSLDDLHQLYVLIDYYLIDMPNFGRKILNIVAERLRSQEGLNAFGENPEMLKCTLFEYDKFLVEKLKRDLPYVHSVQKLDELNGGGGSFVALSIDGKVMVSACDFARPARDKRIKVWLENTIGKFVCAQTLDKTNGGHEEWIHSLVISLDGKTFVSGSIDSSVKIWRMNVDGRFHCIQTLEKRNGGHATWVSSLALSLDGKTIVSGDRDNLIKVWEKSETGQFNCIQTLDETNGGHKVIVHNYERIACIDSLVLSVDGNSMVSSAHDSTIRIWRREKDRLFRCVQTLDVTNGGHKDYVMSVALSEDGYTIVSGSTDKTIKVWTRNELDRFVCTQTLDERDIDAERNLEIDFRHIKEDLAAAERALERSFRPSIRRVALSPDGKSMISGNCGGIVKIWKRDEGGNFHCIQVLNAARDGNKSFVASLGLLAGGNCIFSAADDLTINVWESLFNNISPQQAMFLNFCLAQPGKKLDLRVGSGLASLVPNNKRELLFKILHSFPIEDRRFLAERHLLLPRDCMLFQENEGISQRRFGFLQERGHSSEFLAALPSEPSVSVTDVTSLPDQK